MLRKQLYLRMESKISFKNDYSEGAHPKILENPNPNKSSSRARIWSR
ncbi:Uncharacterised protein [Sphingobacterium daejeonense]|nr:Uncharacterised protein [Sphingobacterium daejeonense]